MLSLSTAEANYTAAQKAVATAAAAVPTPVPASVAAVTQAVQAVAPKATPPAATTKAAPAYSMVSIPSFNQYGDRLGQQVQTVRSDAMVYNGYGDLVRASNIRVGIFAAGGDHFGGLRIEIGRACGRGRV